MENVKPYNLGSEGAVPLGLGRGVLFYLFVWGERLRERLVQLVDKHVLLRLMGFLGS